MLIKIFLPIFVVVFSTISYAQTCGMSIIPQPKTITCNSGNFKFDYKTKIVATDETGRKTAGIFNDLLMRNYGFKLEFASDTNAAKRNFVKINTTSNDAKDESYVLKFTKDAGEISGSETGQFYALQTLMQILPSQFKGSAKIPVLEINDAPRFGYRGMHLDVSRHFFPVSFVKKYLDLMSQYKFNRFHWHLSDDQGWRVEIKKYPRLTEIGSKRSESHTGRYTPAFKGDGIPVEGFFTQDEIREVVAYAKARKITVIPEIDLPGHSSAILAAYPEYGCKENYKYEVQKTWGIFKEVLCPYEKTFQFLDDVFSEIVPLFPDSPYIHIGGDEVLKDHWKESAFVQELKQREGLKDEHEVQSYIIRRLEKIIASKGKKIIGWDEILEGGLAPNATVMSWRGEKGGIEAARSKHDVIMTPSSFLYFDYGQGDPQYEPVNIGNYVPLETVYSYNPIPKELAPDERKYILGAQANIWAEYLKKPENVEYMLLPRMIALSEVVWSPQESRNYADFLRRIQRQYEMLDKQNVNYRIPSPIGLQNMLLSETDKVKINLASPIEGGKIFYTLDGTIPNDSSKVYAKPFELSLKPDEKIELKTIVVNSKGRKSVPYSATILRREKVKGIDLTNKISGVNLKFFRGLFKSVNDLETAQPTETKITKSILLTQFAKTTNELKDQFGAVFEGYIYAPEDAIYEFELESDDGADLQIGSEMLINLDGDHSITKKSGLIPLAKGYHKLKMRYFQSGGDSGLGLRWGIKGTGLRRIYGSELFTLTN